MGNLALNFKKLNKNGVGLKLGDKDASYREGLYSAKVISFSPIAIIDDLVTYMDVCRLNKPKKARNISLATLFEDRIYEQY